MNLKKLANHVRLCKRNLLSERVVCCGSCPFEEEITSHHPSLKSLFVQKRKFLKSRQKPV